MIKSILQTLFFGFVMCIAIFLMNYNSSVIAKYEDLIKDNIKTTALIDNEYEERTLEIDKNKNVSYSFTYSFSVKDKKYTGTYNSLSIPEKTEIDIYYSPKNPKVSSRNPQESLSKSTSSPVGFAITILICFLLAAHGVYKIAKRKKK
jgi:hypothetical protein